MIDTKKLTYKYLFFDLDGTVTKSEEGITKAFQYSMIKMGKIPLELSELKRFVGPTLRHSFMELGFTKEEYPKALSYYKERYIPQGLFESEVYEGIEETLQYLKNKNKIIVLATSKEQYAAEKVLEHFHLSKYFDYIAGDDGARDTKSKVIEHAISYFDIKDRKNVLMIGDTRFDILGAKESGVDVMGVCYGYGDKKELLLLNPDYIAHTPHEILLHF